jgi:hypothetical protein
VIGLISSFIPWRLVAILGVAAGIALAVGWVSSRLQLIGELRVQLDAATTTANANAALAKQAEAENERIKGILEQSALAQAGIRSTARKRQLAIVASPAVGEPPLSDAGRAWIDGLPDAASGDRAPSAAPSTKRP